MKKWLMLALCVCLAVSVTACSQRDNAKEPPDMAGASESESAFNSAVAEESSADESLSEPPGDWPADWPEKYKTFDKYLIAQPKNTTIKTYLFDFEKQDYNIIDSPIPDYMITLHDYLIPILEKYNGVQIDRIVYDNSQKKVCVDFRSDYATLYAHDETNNNEILYSIAKTIIENYSVEIAGVYFEIDMKPFMEPDGDYKFESYSTDGQGATDNQDNTEPPEGTVQSSFTAPVVDEMGTILEETVDFSMYLPKNWTVADLEISEDGRKVAEILPARINDMFIGLTQDEFEDVDFRFGGDACISSSNFTVGSYPGKYYHRQIEVMESGMTVKQNDIIYCLSTGNRMLHFILLMALVLALKENNFLPMSILLSFYDFIICLVR